MWFNFTYPRGLWFLLFTKAISSLGRTNYYTVFGSACIFYWSFIWNYRGIYLHQLFQPVLYVFTYIQTYGISSYSILFDTIHHDSFWYDTKAMAFKTFLVIKYTTSMFKCQSFYRSWKRTSRHMAINLWPHWTCKWNSSCYLFVIIYQ